MKQNEQIAVLPVFREAQAFLDFREDLYFPKIFEIKHNLGNHSKQSHQEVLFSSSFIRTNPV